MLTDTQGHIALIHPADAVAGSHGTETNHPHRLAGRGTCASMRQTEHRSRITGAPHYSADSAAATPATHSTSTSEPVQRMAARHDETRPDPTYRDDIASRLAVFGVTRQHTRRGPPPQHAQAHGKQGKGQKKRERGLDS